MCVCVCVYYAMYVCTCFVPPWETVFLSPLHTSLVLRQLARPFAFERGRKEAFPTRAERLPSLLRSTRLRAQPVNTNLCAPAAVVASVRPL